MTLNDKRTIISSKRARNKRKKAQRSMAKALASQTPTDGSSGDEGAPLTSKVSVAEAASMPLSDVRRSDDHGETDDEHDDDIDDDDELVFVCRPTMQDFCTEFVSTAHAYMASCDSGQKVSAWADLRKFTVRIPAFRETRDGYTTYSIVVTTTGDWRKQFQLERRYSEFVAFAAGLDEYVQSSHYQHLREKLGRATPSDTKDEAETESQTLALQWELPPKTWFPMTQTTALEERRSKLEASLKTLLARDSLVVCQIPLVRDFLMLDIFGAQVVEEKLQRV